MKRFCGLLIMGGIVLALLSFQTGCGGGGASTSRGGGQDATLTVSNSPQVGDAVKQAINLVAPATALVDAKAEGVSSAGSAPLISILETVVPAVRTQAANQKQSSSLYSTPCSGGSIDVTNISGIDIHLNVTADVNVNCTTMNGSLKVTLPASAINDIQHVTEFTVEVSSFTYSDPHSSISLTDNFTMVATNIRYSGNSLTSGSLTLGGTVSGTIDGSPVNIGCDSLGFQFSRDASNGITASVSGRMNASCIGGWLTIGTNQSVFLPASAHCPTQGEIVASAGGNAIKVNFSTVIGIYFDNTLVQTLTSCNDLVGLCLKP